MSMTAAIIGTLIAALVFLPFIIANIHSRNTLELITLLMCLISAGLSAIAFVSLGAGGIIGGGFFAAIILPLTATNWAVAIFIGLAAALDRMAEKRAKEHTWRLLNNNDEGLRPKPRRWFWNR